jgi:hypothetical protein
VLITAAGAADGGDVTLHLGGNEVGPLAGGDGQDDAGAAPLIPRQGFAAGEVL